MDCDETRRFSKCPIGTAAGEMAHSGQEERLGEAWLLRAIPLLFFSTGRASLLLLLFKAPSFAHTYKIHVYSLTYWGSERQFPSLSLHLISLSSFVLCQPLHLCAAYALHFRHGRKRAWPHTKLLGGRG
jgi:hypothetical protein